MKDKKRNFVNLIFFCHQSGKTRKSGKIEDFRLYDHRKIFLFLFVSFHNVIMSLTVKHFFGTTRLLSKTNRLPINQKIFASSLSSVNSNDDNFPSKLKNFIEESPAKINIPLPDIATYKLGTVIE